jgi:hypothetical protein
MAFSRTESVPMGTGSIEGAGERADPQDAIGVLVDRGDFTRRETAWFVGTMRVVGELCLPEVENVDSAVDSAYPQQPRPIAVDRSHAVMAETVGVGAVVLKQTRHTLRPTVKIMEPEARRHPESILSVLDKGAAVQDGGTRPERVFSEPLGLPVIFDEPGERGRGEQPEIAGLVFVQVYGG